ncbi:MAG: pyruvate dehydrogenase (acetyl-transferring) E1 component subunit alpha [Deltaproteobacteria bacterium]|nr:pyruvate dehydrogenase (acetyl-transferring) E1 component subunit alpha [Deltaproteobacteria bacterium]
MAESAVVKESHQNYIGPERRKQPITFKTLSDKEKNTLETLGRERVIQMVRQMYLIRSFEQRCEQAYQQRKIGGFLHLYVGQEAVGAGMIGAISPEDYVVTSYRDHGIALALGISANALMAELFGKSTGVSRGKGGSMHFYSKEKNLLGGHGIVGGQIPIGLGAAFTAKYRKKGQVSLIFFGDGAMQQGSFHESANMASLWNLPAIFVVENNQYGMGTAVSRASSVKDMTLKAQGYNMEGLQVDGMNMLDCYAVMKEAVESRRKNPRPMLIEAKTYRYRGHSISDPATYRRKDEVENYQRVDPIKQIRDLLIEMKWSKEADLKALEKAVRDEITASVAFADESPEPDLSERERHVFSD